jgi:hypothetical protein
LPPPPQTTPTSFLLFLVNLLVIFKTAISIFNFPIFAIFQFLQLSLQFLFLVSLLRGRGVIAMTVFDRKRGTVLVVEMARYVRIVHHETSVYTLDPNHHVTLFYFVS